MSAVELAQEFNADPLLVQRVLHCCVAYGALSGNPDGYSLKNVSRTFAHPKVVAAIHSMYEFLTPGWIHFPWEVEKVGYKSLDDGHNTAYNLVHSTQGKSLWEIIQQTPYVSDFGYFMERSYNAGRKNWLDFYPVHEQLIRGAEPDSEAVFMVDVGGYRGHQAKGVRDRFEDDIAGRIVVQDLAHALPESPPAGVETMLHDFFTPQPVHGARFYYLRLIRTIGLKIVLSRYSHT